MSNPSTITEGLGTIVEGMSVIEDEDGKIWTAAFYEGAFRYDGEERTKFSIRGAQIQWQDV
ncbi:MAG: hypothetical protein O2800_07740 [Planctomycetota bacterium]|nr:hypothetical protein [Planctomycetota bacterium]